MVICRGKFIVNAAELPLLAMKAREKLIVLGDSFCVP